jgi:hypothetical protein
MNRNRVARWVFLGVLLAILTMSFSAVSFGQIAVGISVRIGPPALPVYAQPICPGPGYFWTPGYWAWDDDDGYYWVPGTWVVAPVGMFWTPGWWGWNEGFYVFHGGYWGPHVGFYGGINYGFGYTGEGFYGGEWRGRDFYYNRNVTNVNVTNITNVYNKTVIVNNTTVNHVSYNGGNGGIAARPTSQQLAAEHEQHQAPLAVQAQHQQAAVHNRELFARVNQGRPPVAATARPADFHAAVPARAAGAPYHAPAISPREARGPATTGNRPLTPANSNNANRAVDRPMSSPSPRDNSKANSPKSNDGFRPFTPPSRGSTPNNAPNNNVRNNTPNNPSNNTRPGSTARPNDNRPSNNQPSNSRPSNNYPSSNRPADNRPTRESNPPPSASRPSNSRPDSPRPQSARPQYDSHPQSAPRPPQPQHESAPRPAPQRQESAPPPPQRRESAPPPSPQRHENPPPPAQHQENAPREPGRPNKGR